MSCSNPFSVSVPVFILISLFSLSSWINVVGMWVELPIMVQQLPEKWSLPSYMTLVIQCCNIAPAIYSLISKIKLKKNYKISSSNTGAKRDVILSFVIILISILSAFLTSLFWNKTAFIVGSERSVALMSLLIFSSLASCTSSLVYLPYMARYPNVYLSAFYFGQGLSGLLPGLIGLGQGLGGNPTCMNVTVYNSSCFNDTFNNCSEEQTNHFISPVYPPPKFSVQIFLLIISLLLVISLMSFYLLNFSRMRRFQITHGDALDDNSDDKVPPNEEEGKELIHGKNNNDNYSNGKIGIDTNNKNEIKQPSLSGSDPNESNNHHIPIIVLDSQHPSVQLSKSRLILYLISIVVINMATNGIIPATQSYTCLPYSNMVYTLTVRLSSVVGSLASLSTMFLPNPNFKIFVGMISVALSIVVFHLVVAVLSPHPPLVDNIYGPILIVSTALIMTALFSFTKVTAATRMHSYGGRRALMWCGAVTQLGSFIGAMLAFGLINWGTVFTSISPCGAVH